tara:strand:+ start:17282 stop:17515 length:234 start_codon:yes stop_codon:yes gene_type:complete
MEAVTTRRLRLEGKLHQKGDPISLPADQLEEFEAAGLVKRAAKKAATPKATAKPRSKAPVKPKSRATTKPKTEAPAA